MILTAFRTFSKQAVYSPTQLREYADFDFSLRQLLHTTVPWKLYGSAKNSRNSFMHLSAPGNLSYPAEDEREDWWYWTAGGVCVEWAQNNLALPLFLAIQNKGAFVGMSCRPELYRVKQFSDYWNCEMVRSHESFFVLAINLLNKQLWRGL